MVLDGGGHFSPAGIVGSHTLSLLLSSRTAHDRAAVDSHTQDKRTEEYLFKTREESTYSTLTRGYSNPRSGGNNSVPR